MSLKYGTGPDSAEGMTLAIYAEMDIQLSPPLLNAIDNAQENDEKEAAENALKDARANWVKLSYAISKGVVDHIKANMEILGVETRGDVEAAVEGDTEAATPGGHVHKVILTGNQTGVVFTQSNDGLGRVN